MNKKVYNCLGNFDAYRVYGAKVVAVKWTVIFFIRLPEGNINRMGRNPPMRSSRMKSSLYYILVLKIFQTY